MDNEQRVAIDIYTYLYRTYYGTTKEEINYRVKYGSNGAVSKVLKYIAQKYITRDEENEECMVHQ